MGRLTGKIINHDGIRLVPGYADIGAIKTKTFSSFRCTACRKPIIQGAVMWFCDGMYLRTGEDGRWHDKCIPSNG
jgi:hypothetical protein